MHRRGVAALRKGMLFPAGSALLRRICGTLKVPLWVRQYTEEDKGL